MGARRTGGQAGHRVHVAQNPHGGQESTILALTNVFYHWGGVIVPPGYTSDTIFAAGGNPYGSSVTMDADGDGLKAALAAARHQGARLAEVAAKLAVHAAEPALR